MTAQTTDVVSRKGERVNRSGRIRGGGREILWARPWTMAPTLTERERGGGYEPNQLLRNETVMSLMRRQEMSWFHHLIWTKTAFPSMETSRTEVGTVSLSSVKDAEPGDASRFPGANEQLCFREPSLHPAISQTYYKWFHNVSSPVFLTWLIKPTVWRNRCKVCEVATQQGAKPLTTVLLPNVCGRMNCIHSCLHVVRQMSLLNFQRWSKLNYWRFFFTPLSTKPSSMINEHRISEKCLVNENLSFWEGDITLLAIMNYKSNNYCVYFKKW